MKESEVKPLIKSYMEFDQQYINRVSRIQLDYVHSTLQEVINGNIDKSMLEQSMSFIEEIRDDV